MPHTRSLRHVGLQPPAWGCSLQHGVAAWCTWGRSLHHVELQPLSCRVAASSRVRRLIALIVVRLDEHVRSAISAISATQQRLGGSRRRATPHLAGTCGAGAHEAPMVANGCNPVLVGQSLDVRGVRRVAAVVRVGCGNSSCPAQRLQVWERVAEEHDVLVRVRVRIRVRLWLGLGPGFGLGQHMHVHM